MFPPPKASNDVNMGSGQQRIRKLIQPPSVQMQQKRAETIGAYVNDQGDLEDKALIFPMDLSAHYMILQFYRYNFKETVAPGMKLQQTILLPVPLNLVEQINTSYNEANLGAIGGEISDMIARANGAEIEDKAQQVMDGIGNFVSSVKDTITGKSSVGDLLRKQETGIATMGFRQGDGAMAAGLNRMFASAPNPHITALFQGVGLRTHNFNWKLAPNTRDEADMLAKIINSFRASMLPARGHGNLTLKYPDEVDISIMGTQAKYIYHFKRAVIRNMGVNYAPDGVLSFFGDEKGGPTSVQLNLDLMETSIHTREDYQGGEALINFEGADNVNAEAEITGALRTKPVAYGKYAGL